MHICDIKNFIKKFISIKRSSFLQLCFHCSGTNSTENQQLNKKKNSNYQFHDILYHSCLPLSIFNFLTILEIFRRKTWLHWIKKSPWRGDQNASLGRKHLNGSSFLFWMRISIIRKGFCTHVEGCYCRPRLIVIRKFGTKSSWRNCNIPWKKIVSSTCYHNNAMLKYIMLQATRKYLITNKAQRHTFD